ncbi:MAG: hypothetical protein KDA31_13355 [Phycisphaerales bacterium]|nr:hypothetical protein [Phycisphaerales bacterium]MCB9836217.1 hypothetical protein [Phycisphaera sp.]
MRRVHQLLATAIVLSSGSIWAQCGTYCLADTNTDGSVTPADFSAWVTLYNAGDPAADINQDGNVTPADYSAWVDEYNKGPNGTCCPGPIYMLVPCGGGTPIYTKNDMSACLGQFVEYETDEFAHVLEWPGEDLDTSQLTAIEIISCESECPSDDGPDIDSGVSESSIVLTLASTCEPRTQNCVLADSGLDVPDTAVSFRLFRNGFADTAELKPTWQGAVNGGTVDVLYDGTSAGLMKPYHQRWEVYAHIARWPSLTCTGCSDFYPMGSYSDGGTNAAGVPPEIWDCNNSGKPPEQSLHYAVPIWILLSDYDGAVKSTAWGGQVCENP